MSNRSAREAAESARDLAKLHYTNAQAHYADVCGRFGAGTPERQAAAAVLLQERRALVAAYDALLDLDAGVPQETGQ